jgi:hypothetical protein
MTSREHTAQRDLVAASLRVDELRETHRSIYPLRGREAGRDAVQAMHESMRPMRKVRRVGKWS